MTQMDGDYLKLKYESFKITRIKMYRKQIQREIAQENAAVLQRDVIENEWDSDFSTVSPSEMTTTDQSKLLSPLANQSTPFRLPEKKKKSSAKQKTTNNSRVKQSTVTTPSSLTSMDTWYGLPSLIETIEREELEAFTKPTPEDNEWVAQAHRYFDNEKVYTRKTSKPAVGRRLRIGKFQKKRWTSVLREMALRHPLPVNPAPFSLSKAMCELKLRPEKRFTMPNP
ncbi:hypothetical protein DICVIV_04191 [Dictyocaulus viviparus]|uniref:Uncharacterized protein n=1 Tax=Dictyocaulus viviparus TaxID=29172 RepID=A0A0D8Y4Z5_DICVI|nr:hypothetical protein DICVIV_04191 [Dictyocaulus viviparus]